MSRHTWLLLLTLSVLWGATFVFAGVALRELPPTTLVLARVALAAIALLATLGVLGQPWPTGRRLWGAFLVMGLLNNIVPFTLIFWGQTEIAAGLAAILNATTPLWTVLLAPLVTRDERLRARRVSLVSRVGFAGVVLVVGPDALGASAVPCWPSWPWSRRSFSYACAGLFGRRFPPPAAARYRCRAAHGPGGAWLALPVLLLDRPWELPMPGAGDAGLGWRRWPCLRTALAYVLYFRILAVAGATNLLLVTFLIPVSALSPGRSRARRGASAPGSSAEWR